MTVIAVTLLKRSKPIAIKLNPADRLFSLYIRSRDRWTCQRCKTFYPEAKRQGIQCSHYWGRARFNTRFDPDNCIALCYHCHMKWGHGDERYLYDESMKKKLGEKGFKNLMVRANTYAKQDWKGAKIYAEALLKSLASNQ